MSPQNNQCEKCSERYTDIYTKWCKPCHINYLKNNFTNWTSGNEKIDNFIQEMQLKIIYYNNIVVEWIPYNQFTDIKKIRNYNDNVATMYSAVWNNGPLNYDDIKKEWTRGTLYYDYSKREYLRKSNERVTLKCLSLDINEFLSKAERYSISNKIYGITQNPNTKEYIIICQDVYCEECGEKYACINNKWCIPCQINHLKDNFTNWISKSKEIDIFIQKMQSRTIYFNRDLMAEWIPYNQLIDIKGIRNDNDNNIITYSATWNNGPLNYNYDKRKWIRESNKKVTLKCLALDINKFLNEVEIYLSHNRIHETYGIAQNPNTNDYIIVCQNEYCEECDKEYTNINYKWCKPCQINNLKDNFINWTSGNKEIDLFIQETQLKTNGYNDIIVEWIPYTQFIDVKKIRNDDKIAIMYSAIWNNGPLKYNYKKEWIRKSNERVTLKYSALDVNEFLNEVKNYLNYNHLHNIYGITQNPSTNNYIIVCQNKYCDKCDKEYTNDIYYKWCKSCQINHLKDNFINWTSGNKEIDIFIQDMQLKIDKYNDIIVEWIPYNQLIDIKEIRNDDDNAVIIYSAIWNNGPLKYDRKQWKRVSNKKVTLFTYPYNMIDKFLNKTKNYSIKNENYYNNKYYDIDYNKPRIYGISQSSNIKSYIIVLHDQYCENCGKEYTDKYFKWCKQCTTNYLKSNFTNWTSKNKKIDDFIQEMQLQTGSYYDIIVEWIPYNQFDYIKEIGRGGFATVYSAIWKDGPLEYSKFKKKYHRFHFKEVALKCLDNSENITNEFLNEIKAYSINTTDQIIKIYGISQNPDTKKFIMVLQYAESGNFDKWMRYYYKSIDCYAKLNVLCHISKGLKKIHQKQMVHRDFHTGNILINNHYTYLLTKIYLPTAAYISDLGLCGEASNTNKTNIYGVMPYVAPEVLRGKPYTQAADIYSFGMVMYFLITGSQPFKNRAHDLELALDICNGIRPEIPEISELKQNWYIDLMKKCWDSNVENRPNIELINTILNEKNWNDDEFKVAEKCFKEYKENNQLATHPQAIYTSRLLNPYTEGLAVDLQS